MFKQRKKSEFNLLAVDKIKNKKVFYGYIKDGLKTNLFLTQKYGTKFKNFQNVEVFSENGTLEKLNKCRDFRFFHSGKYWYLTFLREYSRFIFDKQQQTVIAKSSDNLNFKIIDRENDWKLEAFTSVSRHSHKNNFLAYFSDKSIYVASSKNLKNWHLSGKLISSRKDHFDKNPLQAIDALTTKRGILVLYESKKSNRNSSKIKLGGALFSLDQPYKILWRSEEPLLEKTLPKGSRKLKYIGSIVNKNFLELYWSIKGNKLITAKIKTEKKGIGSLKKRPTHLTRHHRNPIITPQAENSWEYDSTFNPAALYIKDKIHLIYRAIGKNGVSVFGYASSNNGFDIDERINRPAFTAMDFSRYTKNDQALYPSKYVSGGSWIGCEDPRMTKIGNRIYMTYTSFDGWNPPGVALTSISVKDFLAKSWTWKRPVLISKQGEIQKNWMLFPEKINGKYAVLHSITPEILIEYVDDLDKEGLTIESYKKPGKEENRWDNIMRGAGSPPIKTKYGWLVLYHAMDKRDPNRYKVGAMLLDLENPTKIIHRSSCPILEPDESYENNGFKPGVVYVCGAVIKDDTLFVYYGGSDSVVCVATADINNFLKDIIQSNITINKLNPRKKLLKKNKPKKKRALRN